ncbi:hypothetical protein [Dethiothermospora halolimnae]|uniref:hypothetical protein n=1 Tax=Dethiothermospora halolimnae TaxID=3114390 RepID=UPI003CCC3FC9
MKKAFKKLFILSMIFCITIVPFIVNATSISVLDDPKGTHSIKTIFPRKSNSNRNTIMPMIDGFGTEVRKTDSDSDPLYVCGIRTNASLEVKVIDGLFRENYNPNTGEVYDTQLFLDDRGDIYINTLNSEIINTPKWEEYRNNTEFSTVAKIQGEEYSSEFSRTLTYEEAHDFLLTGGIDMSIPGFGSISSTAELKDAYKSSETKRVSAKMTHNFKAYFDVDMEVRGLGKIKISVK